MRGGIPGWVYESKDVRPKAGISVASPSRRIAAGKVGSVCARSACSPIRRLPRPSGCGGRTTNELTTQDMKNGFYRVILFLAKDKDYAEEPL